MNLSIASIELVRQSRHPERLARTRGASMFVGRDSINFSHREQLPPGASRPPRVRMVLAACRDAHEPTRSTRGRVYVLTVTARRHAGALRRAAEGAVGAAADSNRGRLPTRSALCRAALSGAASGLDERAIASTTTFQVDQRHPTFGMRGGCR